MTSDRFRVERPGRQQGKTATWLMFREEETPRTAKTRRISVWTKDMRHCLGIVQWSNAWRRYAFEPCFPTVFEMDCLRDLATLLEQLTLEHRNPKLIADPGPDANWAQEDAQFRTRQRAEPRNLKLLREEDVIPDPRSLSARYKTPVRPEDERPR
jgi:hypothetical protein